jgi:hypothetical protein
MVQKKRLLSKAKKKNGGSPFIQSDNTVTIKDTYHGREVKFYSANLTSTWSSVSTTQTTLDATDAIAVGTAWNQRIGTKIRVVGVVVTGALCGGQTSGVADDPYNSFRMMLTQQDYSSTISTTTPGYVTNCQALNVDRIHSVKDVLLQSDSTDSTGYLPSSKWIKWCVPLNVLIKYNSSGHPISSLKITMVSDSGTTPNPGFTNGQWTIAFVDE